MNKVQRTIDEIARICYARKITGKNKKAQAFPCSAWKLKSLMAEPETKEICGILARLNKGNWCSQEELAQIMQLPLVRKAVAAAEAKEGLPAGSITAHKDVFDAVKSKLPFICWLSYRFDDDHRVKDSAHENGFYIADYDGIDNPRQLIKEQAWDQPEFFKRYNIVYIGITPSAHGIRIVAERPEGMTLLQANKHLANQLNISALGLDNDTSVCESSRASYLVPTDYLIYANWDKLKFASQEEADMVEQQCKTANTADNNARSATFNGSLMAFNGENDDDVLIEDNYQGAKYTDIVDYIMEQWGCKPDSGKRHPTYIRLAGNMRNICKDNPYQLAAATS